MSEKQLMQRCVTSAVEAISLSFFQGSLLPYLSTFSVQFPPSMPPPPTRSYSISQFVMPQRQAEATGTMLVPVSRASRGLEIKPSWQAGSAASRCPLKRPRNKRKKEKAKWRRGRGGPLNTSPLGSRCHAAAGLRLGPLPLIRLSSRCRPDVKGHALNELRRAQSKVHVKLRFLCSCQFSTLLQK